MKNMYNDLKQSSSVKGVAKVSAILILMLVWILIDKGNVYGQSLAVDSKVLQKARRSNSVSEDAFTKAGGGEDGDIIDEGSGSDGDNSFDAFPNPFEQDLVFDFEFTVREGAPYEVVDVQGKLVEQGTLAPGASQYKVDLGNLKTGMYFVRVDMGSSVQVKRIIKR